MEMYLNKLHKNNIRKMYVVLTPDSEYGYPILATEMVFKTIKKAEKYIEKCGKYDKDDYLEIQEVGYYG